MAEEASTRRSGSGEQLGLEMERARNAENQLDSNQQQLEENPSPGPHEHHSPIEEMTRRWERTRLEVAIGRSYGKGKARREIRHGSGGFTNTLSSRRAEPDACRYRMVYVVDVESRKKTLSTCSGAVAKDTRSELNALGDRRSQHDTRSRLSKAMQTITEILDEHLLTSDEAFNSSIIEEESDPNPSDLEVPDMNEDGNDIQQRRMPHNGEETVDNDLGAEIGDG
ncbi:hypothetical protein R1sor_004972 [Riccia sorocarpa]|uniref:Uncharacterized protein n=1 Tax=Riccia sorocarpa TaxID=122646 RepID=A0ABD3HK68_9MARC